MKRRDRGRTGFIIFVIICLVVGIIFWHWFLTNEDIPEWFKIFYIFTGGK